MILSLKLQKPSRTDQHNLRKKSSSRESKLFSFILRMFNRYFKILLEEIKRNLIKR